MSNQLNINEMLIDEPKFSIFVKALTVTELIDKLKERGPFTILAPSDSAFGKLPESKLSELLKPLNKANLTEIMKYHIIAGKMLSDDLAKFRFVGTFQNQRLRIKATNFGFKVNSANLQSRNIEASNGVIHGIDTVLFPAFAMQAA